ncbi:hypothetical protein ACIA8K_19250 [Catenuloplanes sp. NPDC051500]|uniref:hypothetical protein n=1 Tax=Catenuloplanes sp. NPDC051500 TaxID=3363959 RepID=UPI0037B1530A
MRVSALVLRSFLLGVASGGRSMTGLAAAALTTRPGELPGGIAALTGAKARGLVVAGALGELAADKLPNAPSRLTPPSLAARMLAGAGSAGVLAARENVTPVGYLLPTAAGAAGALVGSVAGARWRAIAGGYGWPSPAAALVEDAAVVGLAAAVTRR